MSEREELSGLLGTVIGKVMTTILINNEKPIIEIMQAIARETTVERKALLAAHDSQQAKIDALVEALTFWMPEKLINVHQIDHNLWREHQALISRIPPDSKE